MRNNCQKEVLLFFFFFWCGKSIPDGLIFNTAGRKTVGFVYHLISLDIEISSPGEAAYFVSSIFH